MNCESGDEMEQPISNPVRVAVVLSQGNRVLRPDVETKSKKSGWNNWLSKN